MFWEEPNFLHWILIAALVVLLGLTLIGMYRSAAGLRAYRRDLVHRAQSLRIHRMLERLGIPLGRYLRRASPWSAERHLMKCECCRTTHDCDRYLEEGAALDERSFCPNFAELVSLARCPKRRAGR